MNKKLKGASVGLLVMLIAKIAKAWAMLVVGIMVILFGAFVIYKLFELMHHVFPPNPPPEPPGSNITYIWTVVNTPVVMPSVVKKQLAEIEPEPPPSGWTVQYGIPLLTCTNSGYCLNYLNTNNVPWIMAGSNLSQSVDGVYSMIIQDTNESLFTQDSEGCTFIVDDAYPDGGADNATNWQTWPHTVVIQVSTDLFTWTPVFTNPAVGLNTVETWTDTNEPPGPSYFYRAFYPPQTNAPPPVVQQYLDGGNADAVQVPTNSLFLIPTNQ